MEQKLLWHYYCIFKGSHSYLEDYKYYLSWRQTYETRTRISPKGWDLINSSVHEALHVYDTKITPKDLSSVFLNGMSNPYRKWRTLRWYPYYLRHRQVSHYVRRDHHEVKTIAEPALAKQTWRKEKGIDKDKQRNGNYRRGAGKHYKRISNSKHRTWEQKKMFQEDYESLSDKDYKLFLDPWMWD